MLSAFDFTTFLETQAGFLPWTALAGLILVLAVRRNRTKVSADAAWMLSETSLEPRAQQDSASLQRMIRWLAGVFLGLGLLMVGQSGDGSTGKAAIAAVSSFAVGFSCLSLIQSPHGGWLAYLGLANLSAGWWSLWVAVGMLIVQADHRSSLMSVELLVIALACSAWWWSWLSQVWRQQLDERAAWTVTGGLVEPARRSATACLLLGLVFAMALFAFKGLTRSETHSWFLQTLPLLGWGLLFLVAIAMRIQPQSGLGRAMPFITALAFAIGWWLRACWR